MCVEMTRQNFCGYSYLLWQLFKIEPVLSKDSFDASGLVSSLNNEPFGSIFCPENTATVGFPKAFFLDHR